ncbi:hypothetical protein [Streptomyces sp. enrichment culture]|uniref:hypothetical protein n=1 Tax=Streptomyces sp. enrichment culture TaxID=1795815 RepID=UPI003F56CA8B
MEEISERALAAVPWERLQSADPRDPGVTVQDVRRLLRRLFRSGPSSTEEDCYDLFAALALPHRGVASVAPAVLPFVVALAADPRTGARTTLVELLVHLSESAREAPPHLVDEGWADAWSQAQEGIQALLADRDPAVRREALPLADAPGRLLERWRAERDPAVRLPVLFALGRRAPGTEAAAETRAVLEALLRDPDPVLRTAAVHASASLAAALSAQAVEREPAPQAAERELSPQAAQPELSPQAVEREQELLVAALTDPAARSRWEEVWYEPNIEHPFDREAVACWTAALFEEAPATATAFLARLAEAADPDEDVDLLRAVLDRAWQLLVLHRSVEPAVLALAARFLEHPDPSVRYRCAHLLAVLGPRAAAHADRLAALLDDTGEDELLEGTVGEHARWALARMGDPRALPGLVDALCAPYRDHYGRGYVVSDPRRPEIVDVLAPLRAHARALLPSVREELRRALAAPDIGGVPIADFLQALTAWGPDARPALPEVTACVAAGFQTYHATEALAAMDPTARARPDAPQPDRAVLEEHIRALADGGDSYGRFEEALRTLLRSGPLSPAVHACLRTLAAQDRRLSVCHDYTAILQDERLRALIEEGLRSGAGSPGPV